MSFSGEVKEDLSQKVSTARHCQIAELAAIMGMCGGVVITSGDRYRVKIRPITCLWRENALHYCRKYLI